MNFNPIYKAASFIDLEELKQHEPKRFWSMLSYNHHAIHILEKNLDKVDREELSGNPNAIHILEKNLDIVDWFWLSRNPAAIHILEKNLDKVNWFMLSLNPAAIHILEKNLNEVNLFILLLNHNIHHVLSLIEKGYNLMTMDQKLNILRHHCIFTLNTKAMMEQCKPFCEELCKYVFSPRRVMRSIELFNYNIVGDEIWVV
jgi:hypothetical protein